MKKSILLGIAISGAFLIGILSANPVIAVGGWQLAFDGLDTRITALEDQAGMLVFETIQVTGTTSGSLSSATCPTSHPFLIGGSYAQDVKLFSSADLIPFRITPEFDVSTNTYRVSLSFEGFSSSITVQAFALCANLE